MSLDLDQTYGPDFYMSCGHVVHRGHGPRDEFTTARREAAIAAAGLKLAASDAAIAAMTPREQAEAAWTPTSPFGSVDELEDVIRAHQGLPPVHLSAAAVAETLRREAERLEQWRGGAPESSPGVDGLE